MTHLAIRQSGGANIVSIPKAILKILGLHVGSTLDLSIVDCKIVLTPEFYRDCVTMALNHCADEQWFKVFFTNT